jgi:hypothetical protein
MQKDYQAPLLRVIEVATKDVICTSVDQATGDHIQYWSTSEENWRIG